MRSLFLLFSIGIVICICMASDETEFPEFHGYEEEHDENEHDKMEDPLGLASMTQSDMVGHLKDIIRGFSDKGVEESDQNGDGFLDETEIGTFINQKMGYSIKTTLKYVVHHYDLDGDKLLSKDEVWRIVENKDPAIFKILPEVMEKNMLLMHGVQKENFEDEPLVSDDGVVIRY